MTLEMLGHLRRWRKETLLWLPACLLLLVPLAAQAESTDVVFPGPIERSIFGSPLSAVALPWTEGSGEYLVVGDDTGYLNLVYHLANNEIFRIFVREQVGGEITSLEKWEGGPAGPRSLVVATANPDRLLFMDITPSAPYFHHHQSLDLPEDPGSLVFVEPTSSGQARLAVSLPGMDALGLLVEEEDGWTLDEILVTGDQPRSLVAVDLDDDGHLEIITADRGALSGGLGVFRLQGDDSYLREEQWSLDDPVNWLGGGDFDLDGIDELIVSYAQTARLDVFTAHEGPLQRIQQLDLAFVPDRLRVFSLFNGHPGLVTSAESQGLVEFLEYADGQWHDRDTYFSGCDPVGAVPCDLNGDGMDELACLGRSSLMVTILLGNSLPGFWGYPARPLPANPVGLVPGDFNGDGRQDLVVSGVNPDRLIFFPGMEGEGPLDQAQVQDLDFFPAALAAGNLLAGGAEEIALVNVFESALLIMQWDDEEGFVQQEMVPLLSNPARFSITDVDGDGFQDLLMVVTSTTEVRVRFGDGAGTFTSPVSVDMPLGVFEARALNLDGDAHAELIVTDSFNRVWVVPNLDGRSFGPSLAYEAASGARYLDLADLDGDLDLDVVVVNTSNESVTMLENPGDGTLIRRVGALSLGGAPRSLALDDLNQDGLADVVVTLTGGSGQQALLSDSPWVYEVPLDIHGSGNVTQTLVQDFNDDIRPDILNLDGDRLLGVVLQNTALVLVSNEDPVLETTCLGSTWGVRIRIDTAADWSLTLHQGGRDLVLAADGMARLGMLENVGDGYYLTVPLADVAGFNEGTLDLISGGQLTRVTVHDLCGAEGGRTPRLQWQQNPWPNPFNPRVEARIRLEDPSAVLVTVHDTAGRQVARLLQEELAAGVHPVTWDGQADGAPAAAGLYFLRVSTEQGEISRKIMLIK